MDIDGRPFRSAAALQGRRVGRRRLRREYRRVLHGVYLRNTVPLTQELRAEAVWEWSRADREGREGLEGREQIVLCCISAAAVLGARYLGDYTHACCVAPTPRNGPAWLRVHQDHLRREELCRIRGMTATTPVRTAFDIARRMPYPANVEIVDQIYQATRLSRAMLAAYAARRPGYRGIRKVRRVIDESDEGAESVWETRARMVVVRAGIPRPETQVVIRTAAGRFIARVDMLWREYRVIFEYDGDEAHRTTAQRDRDIERWNELTDAGYTVIRVRAPHMRGPAPRVIGQLRQALRAAGADV